MSTRLSRRARAFSYFDRSLLLLALLLTAVVLVYYWTPTDPDLWWHLQNGQVVATTGMVPHGDIYSYTVPGARWIMQQWLLETGMYWLETTLGYWANVLLFGLASAATYAVLFAILRGTGAGRMLAVSVVLVPVVLDAPGWGVRPQIFTTLLFSVFLAVLLRYRRVGPDRWLAALVPLMALWANIHAGFIVGFALLAAFIVGEGASHLWQTAGAPVRPLILVTVACVVVSLFNPNGLDLWLYPLTYLGGPHGNPSLRYIQEWQPPDFRTLDGLPMAAVLLALIGLNLVRPADSSGPLPPTPHVPMRLGWPTVDWSLLLAMAGFTLMALQATRFVPLFGICAAVVGAGRIGQLCPQYRGAPQPVGIRRAKMNASVYLLAAVALALVLGTAPRAQLHATPLESSYPAGAVTFMASHHALLPQPLHLFHKYEWGGYLLAHGYSVFVDGRADPYNSLLDAYMGAMRGQGWAELFATYHVNAVLVASGEPLDRILTGTAGWTPAYRDTQSVLYLAR